MNAIIIIYSLWTLFNCFTSIFREKLFSFDAYIKRQEKSIEKAKESFQKAKQIENDNPTAKLPNMTIILNISCAILMIIKIGISITFACHFSKGWFWLVSCGQLVEIIATYFSMKQKNGEIVLDFTEKEIKAESLKYMLKITYDIIYGISCLVLVFNM